LKLGYLFLIRGLILLAAAALLVPLTWFVRHRVGLTGLVPLLRLIRLILLCHVSSPDYQRRFFLHVQRLLIANRTGKTIAGLPSPCTSQTAGRYSNFLFPQKSKGLGGRTAPKLKRN
jgi:hypothetical protein